MKHIKKYENTLTDEDYYKIGDYFLIIHIKPGGGMTDYKAKLLYVRPELKNQFADKYVFEIYDHYSNTFVQKRISDIDIKRRLTPKEIEEFELTKNIIKYNL